jgi:branched-chain amino acid transport system ATP-binding protein
MGALLSVRDLEAGYGKLQILHGVSLEVEEGSVTALIGANGAGKTTLMRAIAGLIPIRAGALTYAGEDLTSLSAHERVERGLTLVPEGRMVFASLTVAQNLRLGAISRRARKGAERRLTEVHRLYPRLAERSRQRAGSLSGGEQQMLAIGRGLMAAPKVLLLDEPSLGLAPIMVKQIFATLRELRAQGYAILLAEQNARLALELADQGCVIENGAVRLTGSGPDLAASEEVRRSYLGL